MTDLATDFAIVHAPARDALELLERKRAAERIAAFAREYMPRVAIQLVPPRDVSAENDYPQWFDWSHLRVNVTHCVEPKLVRWTK